MREKAVSGDRWVPLPQAVLMIQASGVIDPADAIVRLLGWLKDGHCRGRIGTKINVASGPAQSDYEMVPEDWRFLETFDDDWLSTGDAQWDDGHAWLNLQVHAGNLLDNIATIERRVRRIMQPVATPMTSIYAARQANPNLIGNARQQDDNRVAVVDAVSLSDCWAELAREFEQADLTADDYEPSQMQLYRSLSHGCIDDVEAQRWIKSCIMADKATATLRRAVAVGPEAGGLRIWRIHDARELPLAPTMLERDNIKYGIYKTVERPAPDMQGALLWVKRADWDRFMGRSRLAPAGRAPSVKAARPPSDAAILAKADEMKSRGMKAREIASAMRLEPGFENAGTVHVRELIGGRWKPTGRPRKNA